MLRQLCSGEGKKVSGISLAVVVLSLFRLLSLQPRKGSHFLLIFRSLCILYQSECLYNSLLQEHQLSDLPLKYNQLVDHFKR